MNSVRSSGRSRHPRSSSIQHVLRPILLGLLFILFYVIAGKGGLAFASLNKSATAIWLPTGIAIAATLLYGRRVLPAIFVGAFIVNVSTTGDIPSSIGIAFGNMLEAFVAAELVHRFANGRKAFEQPATLFLFALLAGLLSTAVSATIGVATLFLSGFIHPGTLGNVWLTWWVGDGVGAILITPVILLWNGREKLLSSKTRKLEASCLLLAAATYGVMIYSGLTDLSRNHSPVSFFALPILLWVAFRFGIRGTALINTLLALMETLGTLQGYGPYADVSGNASLIVLQGFVGTTSLMSLVGASMVSQYQLALENLQLLNQQVETRVRERTEQLSQANRDLDESQQKIEAARRTLEQLIESTPIGILLAEPTLGKVLVINPAARRIFGHPTEDLPDRAASFWEYTLYTEHGTPYPPSERPVNIVLKTKKSVVNKIGMFAKRTDGSFVPVRVSCAPVEDAHGRIIAIVDIIEDMTKEFQIDRAKTEFVSLAAHQLKTPITAVRYFVELLKSPDAGPLNPTQADYANEIDSVSSSMMRLVSELLNVSRIDLDVFPIEPKDVNLADIAEVVIKELAPMLKTKKMHMVTELDAHGNYFGDPNLLRILFSNLISNAIKFTPDRGTVTIKINGNEQTTRITIADTGYGIPDRQQDKIFTKLFRADNVQTKNIEGTGLGLYIVKAIVERSGGTISFESTEGKGTTFTVFLPSSGMRPKQGIKKLD